MKITYDKSVDAAYINVKVPIKKGEAIKQVVAKDNIILDFDREGKLLGIEILDAHKTLSRKILNEAEQL